MPFRSDYLGLRLKQLDIAATVQLPCPREKQLRTAAARMISVECTNKGDAAASYGARAHRVQRNLGFALGWWRRRILVSCASADFVRPCGSDISRIFSGFFLKAFLVYYKNPRRSRQNPRSVQSERTLVVFRESPVGLDSKSPTGPNLGFLVDVVPAREHLHGVCGVVCSQTSLSIEAAKF